MGHRATMLPNDNDAHWFDPSGRIHGFPQKVSFLWSKSDVFVEEICIWMLVVTFLDADCVYKQIKPCYPIYKSVNSNVSRAAPNELIQQKRVCPSEKDSLWEWNWARRGTIRMHSRLIAALPVIILCNIVSSCVFFCLPNLGRFHVTCLE